MTKINGCDDAILGKTASGVYIYLYDKLVKIFCDQGMSEQEAIEWIDYDIMRALTCLGKNSPLIVTLVSH